MASASTSSFSHISAEELDSWAEIFFEAKCSGLVQVPLSVFLADPLGYIGSDGTAIDVPVPSSEGENFLPLLPAQVEAARRIQEKWARDDARALAMMGSHLTLVPRF